MMYSSLKGQKIIITGGASGIGLATVKRFYEENATVIVLDKNIKSLLRFNKRHMRKIYPYQVDVSNRLQMTNIFAEIKKKFNCLDVVIANAGISIRHPFLKITPQEWQSVMDINLTGVFNTLQLATQQMIKNKHGVILITSSTNGITGHPYYADYNASKAALILLGKTLAKELAPKIRVNMICPGYVLTAMQRAEYTASMLKSVNKIIPLHRHASPKEISNLMAFLASDQASYITGQNIVIDGGEIA